MANPPRGPYKCPLESIPIPSRIMSHVAVDLFMLPEVTVNGQIFDAMALCVDRTSGWIVATPHKNKGLTAEIVAKVMFEHWQMFGLPATVTSDQGSHFAAAWWQTMCALHGVRYAYGQAYHHQANERAEVAGKQVIRCLRRLIADEEEPGVTWVELLPKVLRCIHDAPGESGFSPYEIIFGRHRPLQGAPYTPERRAEDAVTFFDRMAKLDRKVAAILNKNNKIGLAQKF